MQIQAVRLADLRDFFSQLRDALFDGILHDARLAEHADGPWLMGFRLAPRTKRPGIVGSDSFNRFHDRSDSIYLFGKNGANASSGSQF
jgi:hypothetical protein